MDVITFDINQTDETRFHFSGCRKIPDVESPCPPLDCPISTADQHFVFPFSFKAIGAGFSDIILNVPSQLLSMESCQSHTLFCAVYHRAQFWALCYSPCIPSPWPLSSDNSYHFYADDCEQHASCCAQLRQNGSIVIDDYWILRN